ncbi:hypothetical protein [Macellibacteroides fermentans]|nr:hypothetical protein [Macellibacteroides fermentans]
MENFLFYALVEIVRKRLDNTTVFDYWQLVASIWTDVALKLGWFTADLVAASPKEFGGTDKYKKRM